MDQDAAEPVLEARWIPEGRPLAPGLDERIVRGILGVIGIAEDGECQPIARLELPVGESSEGSLAGRPSAGLDDPLADHVANLRAFSHVRTSPRR